MNINKFVNKSDWYLYLIKTRNGALYTGITTDVSRRLMQHRAGKGAKALKGKAPLTLVYHCSVRDKSTALKLEYRVKQLNKQKKERLVTTQPVCIESYLSGNVKFIENP
ncbi:MAG: GIY-YIG nuclease family protein [Enterobacteriaceae bacterium]|jgi:putative endonuclease|nr:GIY-YIG nuclease family protein [Enterobacteriaceae bacterium]